MDSETLIKQIYLNHKYDLMGYKQIQTENIKENTYIKYFNLETNKLSKRTLVRKIYYFSEIKKDKPMKLELYDGIKHHWNIICKHHIVFRQLDRVNNDERTFRRRLDKQLDISNKKLT